MVRGKDEGLDVHIHDISSAAVLAAITLSLAGCPGGKGSDGPGGSGFEMLDPGMGAQSTQPLDPQHPGAVRIYGAPTGLGCCDSYMVEGPVEIGGREVTRQGRIGGRLHLASLLVDGWRGDGDDGQLYVGGTDEALAAPRVELPPTVRVGMRWRGRASPGRDRSTFEVADAGDRDTPWGRRIAWTIRETSPTEATWEHVYLEGIGLLRHDSTGGGYSTLRGNSDFEQLVRDDRRFEVPSPRDGGLFWQALHYNHGDLLHGVVPTSARAPAPPRMPRTALTLVPTEAVENADETALLGGTMEPDGTARIWLTRTRAMFGAGGSYVGHACSSWDGARLTLQRVESAGNLEAHWKHVGSCVTGLRGAPYGEGFAHDTVPLVGPDGLHIPFRVASASPIVGRVPMLTFYDESDRARLVTIDGAGANPDYAVEPLLEEGGGPTIGVLDHAMRRRLFVHDDEGEIAPLQPWTGVRVLSADRAVDGTVGVLVVDEEGLMIHGRLELSEDGSTFRDWKPAGRLSGQLIPFARPQGRDLLHVTPDGDVDRVHIEVTGIRVERIAQLAIPDQQAAFGAFDLGDGQLLVGTLETPADLTEVQEPFDFYDAFGNRTLNVYQRPTRRDVHMWTAPIEHAAVEWTPAPAAGVTIAHVGADLVVCWPDAGEPPPRDGWTLGGQPALALALGDPSCVLVVRDKRHDWRLDDDDPSSPRLEDQDHWLVEGDLPGVGPFVARGPGGEAIDAWAGTRVSCLPPSGASLQATEAVAALRGGGFIVSGRRCSPGGLEVDTLDVSGIADLAGNGMWFATEPGEGAPQLVRFGADGRVEYEIGDVESVRTAVAGGGVVVALTTGEWIVVRPDGATVDAAAVPAAADLLGVLPDGTTCRAVVEAAGQRILCVRPGGEEWEAPEGTPRSWVPLDATSFVASEGGAVTPTSGGYVVDVVEGTLEQVTEGGLVATHDAEGNVWVAFPRAGSPANFDESHTAVGILRHDGVDEIELPLTANYNSNDAEFRLTSLMVDEEVLVVGYWSGNAVLSVAQAQVIARTDR